MIFAMPICYECKHYQRTGNGKSDLAKWENDEQFCAAYPDGIPDRYLTAAEDHTTVQADQKGDTVFDPIGGGNGA